MFSRHGMSSSGPEDYFWHNYKKQERNGYPGMEIRRSKLFITAIAALISTCALLMAFYGAQAGRGGLPAAWNRTFDNGYYDYGSSVRQTADGGYIIGGGASLSYMGDRDALLIKTDGNGSLQWQQLVGGDDFDYGYAVAETRDRGYAMAGITRSGGNGNGDVYLVRTDMNGNVIWENTFGGSGYDESRALLQANDGGFVIAGATETQDNGSDIYLAKTDAVGNLVWERTYGGAHDDLALSVEPTRDGGYIVGGHYGTGSGSGDGYLLRLDEQGWPLWERRLHGEDSVVYQARETGDGGYIAVGYTNFSAGGSEVRLTMTDHAGQLLWQKVFQGDGTLKGYNVFPAPDSGLIIVVETGTEPGYQGLLIKTDAAGNETWRQAYGSDRDVFIRAGTPTRDGGLALIGSIGDRQDVETWDVYLLKTGRM